MSTADKEMTEADKEMTEADKEMIEADKEMTEADKEMTEADKSWTEICCLARDQDSSRNCVGNLRSSRYERSKRSCTESIFK